MKTRKVSGFVLLLMLLLLLTDVHPQAASAKKKALKAYKAFLSKKTVTVIPNKTVLAEDDGFTIRYKPTPAGKVRFAIAYLDNNSIPELLVLESSHKYDSGSQGLGIFTWKNKKVVRVGYLVGGAGVAYSYFSPKSIGYYNRRALMIQSDVSEGVYSTYYKLKNGKLKMEIYKADYYGEVSYGRGASYKELSRKQFNRLIRRLTKGKKMKKLVFRANTPANRKSYLK